LRTYYLGTSEFAAAVLRVLAGSRHAPALVVTPPDRRRGRGRKESSPPAAEAGRELGLTVLQSEDVNDPRVLDAIGATGAEAGAVCAFGQIVRDPLLSGPPLLNVHPSLLPRWRGAAPIERAVMAGDRETGVTIMRPVAELDAGPMALREATEIGTGDYHDVLSARLAGLGGRLLVRSLDLLEAGELEWTEQDDSAATYAEKVTAEERRLDPRRDAAELAWRVRALNPHVGTHLELQDGSRLGVRRARAVEALGLGPGRISERDGRLVMGTGSAALELEEVQAPGGRAMPAAEFLKGHPVPAAAVPSSDG
jgi:methionyl-tRNA formyltransferase